MTFFFLFPFTQVRENSATLNEDNCGCVGRRNYSLLSLKVLHKSSLILQHLSGILINFLRMCLLQNEIQFIFCVSNWGILDF